MPKHAEAIFAVHPSVERMTAYANDLNGRLESKFSRPAGSVKLIYGLQTVVAETRSEAIDKYERIKECIPLEGALAWMSGHFGLDFSKMHLDENVKNRRSPASRGFSSRSSTPRIPRENPGDSSGGSNDLRSGMGMPVAVGTAADIADQMETYMDDGGADGFMLIATYTPGCFEEFVDFVVPELQRRGRLRLSYEGRTLRENLLAR